MLPVFPVVSPPPPHSRHMGTEAFAGEVLPSDLGIVCALPALDCTHPSGPYNCCPCPCLSMPVSSCSHFPCDYMLVHTFHGSSCIFTLARICPCLPHSPLHAHYISLYLSLPTHTSSYLPLPTYTCPYILLQAHACSQLGILAHTCQYLHTPVHTCFPLPMTACTSYASPYFFTHAQTCCECTRLSHVCMCLPHSTQLAHSCPHLPMPAHCLYQSLWVPISSYHTCGFH